VLPTDGMNINSLNIRESVFSAASAFAYSVDKSSVLGSSGLAVLMQKGASEQQLIHHGNSTQCLMIGVGNPIDKTMYICIKFHGEVCRCMCIR